MSLRNLLAVIALTTGMVCTAAAQSERINYQGYLTDGSGQPVADSRYSISFSIWNDSTAGTRLWLETHPAVTTAKGMFSVVLGSLTALDASVFGDEDLFLEIAIGISGPLSPRTRLVSVPRAATAGRMNGDIKTGEGFLHLDALNSAPLIRLDAPGQGETAALTMFNPDGAYPGQPLVRLNSDTSGGHLEFLPAGDYRSDPTIRMGVGPSPFHLGRMEFFDPSGTTPHDPYIRMGVEPSPFLGGRLEFFQPSVSSVVDPAIRMGIEPVPWRASLALANPQPGLAGSGPSALVQTTPDSADLSLAFSSAAEQADESSGSQPGSTAVGASVNRAEFKLHCDLQTARVDARQATVLQFRLQADASGGSASFLSGGSEYMGIEPSPFRAGGDLTMSDPTGAATIRISSEGSIGIGTGVNSRILTVKQSSATDPIADAWTIYSSRRWKTNIETIKTPLARVMALRGVTFDWRETGQHDIGLIAEEVGRVVPEVVAYEENGVDAQSVDYARLTALLIEAVKEQQGEIEKLASRIGSEVPGGSATGAGRASAPGTHDLESAPQPLSSGAAETEELKLAIQKMREQIDRLAEQVEKLRASQEESPAGDLAARL